MGSACAAHAAAAAASLAAGFTDSAAPAEQWRLLPEEQYRHLSRHVPAVCLYSWTFIAQSGVWIRKAASELLSMQVFLSLILAIMRL